MATILINAAARTGRTFTNEHEFRTAIERGDTVYTLNRGVYFAVTLDGDAILYSLVDGKPADIG